MRRGMRRGMHRGMHREVHRGMRHALRLFYLLLLATQVRVSGHNFEASRFLGDDKVVSSK